MCGVRRTIFINSVVGITVISYDNSFVIIGLGSLYHLLYTVVNGPDSLGNGMINTRMSHHVTIGKVHNYEVILLRINGSDELLLYFQSAHFRLQVVCRHLWRRHKYTVFVLKRLFTATVKEEGYMGIFLCFGCMQLLFAQP